MAEIQDNIRLTSMTSNASTEIHKALERSLRSINDYFEAPLASRQNLVQDIKVANNVLNTFAKIRQSESGSDMVKLQMAKWMCRDKKEIREFMLSNLPHLVPLKQLKQAKL